MFSSAYARLIAESGINHLLASFRVQSIILEAKDDPENILKNLTIQAKNNPEVKQYLTDNWEQLWDIIKGIQSFEQSSKQPTLAAFIGGDKSYGHLFYLLANDAEQFFANSKDVLDVWNNIISLFRATAGKEVEIQGQRISVPKDVREFLKIVRDLKVNELLEFRQYTEENLIGEKAHSSIANKFPGTETIYSGSNLLILKFPQGSDPATIESLKKVGDLRPREFVGKRGVCTRGSDPNCQAERYLKDNTIYAGIKQESDGRPVLEFQAHFNTSPEIKDHMNENYGALKGPAFDVILKDIIGRAAPQVDMTAEQLYGMVKEVLKQEPNDIFQGLINHEDE